MIIFLILKIGRHCRQNLKNEALDLEISLRLIFIKIFKSKGYSNKDIDTICNK